MLVYSGGPELLNIAKKDLLLLTLFSLPPEADLASAHYHSQPDFCIFKSIFQSPTPDSFSFYLFIY